MKNKIIIGFTVILLPVLLKITGLISWSWWWVTAPIWVPLLIAIIAVGAFLILANQYIR